MQYIARSNEYTCLFCSQSINILSNEYCLQLLIRVKKGFSLLAISGVINDNAVHRECRREHGINGSLLLSTRDVLEIGADYWTLLSLLEARGHRKPVTVVRARVPVTLILAPCVLPCCKLLAA